MLLCYTILYYTILYYYNYYSILYCTILYYTPISVQGALQYKGHSTHDRTMRGRRTIHDQYMFSRFIYDICNICYKEMCIYIYIYICICIYIYIYTLNHTCIICVYIYIIVRVSNASGIRDPQVETPCGPGNSAP